MDQKTKSFLKENWFRISILSLIILLIGGSFYWYGIRPAKIKSNCAWVEEHLDAIPAQPASSNWPGCLKSTTPKTWEEFNKKYDCHDAIPAQPAKDSKIPVFSNEYYLSCLHEHGL